MKDQTTPAEEPQTTAGQARHGYRNEVNWEGGSGRQPYSNQGRREMPSPAAGEAFVGGNPARPSGQNQAHLERVKTKPCRGGRAARRVRARASEHAEQHQQDDDRQRDAEQPEDDGHLGLLGSGMPPRYPARGRALAGAGRQSR